MDRKNLFTKVLIVFLALMFLGGVALGAVEVLSAEGQMPPEAGYQKSLTHLPSDKEEIINYLNKLVRFAAAEDAKLDVKTEISVEDDSVAFGENGDMLVKAFQYAKASVLNEVAGQYRRATVDFGGDFTGALWNLDFDGTLINQAQSEEDGENYTFRLLFPSEDDPFGSGGIVNDSFHMRDSQKALEFLRDSYSGLARVEHAVVKCAQPGIEAVANRLTDKIDHVAFIKEFDIQADITFLGELEALGTRRMTFHLREKTVFSFTWAGLRLTPQTLNMEKGDIKVIGAIVTAPGDMTVRWSSSAPEIASVDSDGYVKGLAVSLAPVVITAAFDYLGRTYSDTCEVYVKVPVKKVELSKKKVTLAVGERITLEAAVKPKDATIKDVIWQAANPAIARVDENGQVTAVTKGETEIIALSKDGYYKITCTVTVTA